MSMFRILVCGGRNFDDKKCVFDTLDELVGEQPHDHIVVIEGGARGADRLGRQWAREHGHTIRIFEADWEHHGKSAGFRRNRKMLIEGKPDIVVAFPGGNGTNNMTEIATKAGVKVMRVTQEN